MTRALQLAAASLLVLVAASSVAHAQGNLVVRNNHEIPYRGPIDLRVDLPDGSYLGPAGAADVRGGQAHIFVAVPPKGDVTLTRRGAPVARPFGEGMFGASTSATSIALSWQARQLADVALGLVVVPGSVATIDTALHAFTPLSFTWTNGADGVLNGVAERDGYVVNAIARPYGEGWLDVRTSVVAKRAPSGPAYVALVRRVITPAARDAKIRFNGRELAGGDSPSSWEGDFRYVHGVDWAQWSSGSATLLSVNGFTPTPSVKHDTTWAEGSSFYVRERTRQARDTMWLVSEIAGPNPDQPKRGYMAVLPYAQPVAGDTVALKWRLAVEQSPSAQWAEVQLREFAGTRSAVREGANVRASIGVPYTLFGMAYFPYSTFSENFDFYRVPGLNSENFWPTSAAMWKQWRVWEPRMRTDMHIIRSMGFDVLRLHHLELLQAMPRAEALAFLDFYAKEARALGFKLMIDTEGPPEWVTEVLSRYRDVVVRVELENEVLIPGISPAEPARWKALYAAAKAAAPKADAFFTGAGNNSMFERLKTLGVPFDRVGLHAYKHGPAWKEAWGSHALGTAGYATELGKPMTLGEFNWKDLTLLSPEARPAQWDTIYRNVLATRSVHEVIQFQFQEQIAFNTTVGGTKSRHYEPVGLDRRPKPEAFVAMNLMREYGRPDMATRVLPVVVEPVKFANGRAEAGFTITNNTGVEQTVSIEAQAFEGVTTKLLTARTVRMPRGTLTRGRVAVVLEPNARPGTYHHFVQVAYKSGAKALGWGVAANEGAPTFADTSVLKELVAYAGGPGVVKTIRFDRPLQVFFGTQATALEVEDAYQLKNTLQSATGRNVRVSSEADLPPRDSLQNGTAFFVGTPTSSALVRGTKASVETGKGSIAVGQDDGTQWITLAGVDAKGAHAAVVELELRFWPNAKDATIRITGLQKGKALGNSAGGSTIDPP